MDSPRHVTRVPLHSRRIDMKGFRRSDGLYDIEASLVDTKSHDMHTATGRKVVAGTDVHCMLLRLVVDRELQIVEVEADTLAAPYGVCMKAPASLQALVGLRIGPGWARAVRERLTGARGCTHMRELLGPLATAAFQTLSEVRQQRLPMGSQERLLAKRDSCLAYAAEHAQDAAAQPLHYTPWSRAGIGLRD